MLMFISMGVVAQKPYKVFCELVGTGKLLSNKVSVTIDFGQETSFWTGASKQHLVDNKGKKNSIQLNGRCYELYGKTWLGI